jgi:hypothetical protein
MKVIVSLTSTPPRLALLGEVITRLLAQACHEVWVNIPRRYNRWPAWNGDIPGFLYEMGPKVIVNRECEDLGPGTKYLGPAHKLLPEDLIVYVDDDTLYDSFLVKNLLKWWNTDQTSAWGLSGFTLENYFKGYFPRQHGTCLDIVEGYGGVIVKAGWIQNLREEFIELLEEAKFADDVVLSNLLEKRGIARRSVFCQECHVGQVQQLAHGFQGDALHNQSQGGHKQNYFNVLKNLKDKDKLYMKFNVSSMGH